MNASLEREKDEVYIPESIDPNATFTVATTYCTGRVTVEYPETARAAVRLYTHRITSQVRQDNQNVVGDGEPAVHIKMVTYIRRNEDGEIVTHIDSKDEECNCAG